MKLPNLPADRQIVTPADGRPTDGWWLFFDALVKWLRANGGTVYGTLAQRTVTSTRGYVSPGSVAEGTVYVETDTDVLYQMRGGSWAALDLVLGAASLTHAGVIPKVSAAGTIGESAVKDDGALVTILARILSVGAATAWASAILQAHAGSDQNFAVSGKTTLADGVTLHSFNDAVSANKGMELRALAFLFAVGKVGVLTAGAPAYEVDVNGDVNASGVYRIGGTQVVGAQGAAVTSPAGGGTAVAAPSGGATQDLQARAAIVSIIAAISSAGNTVDPAARTAIDAIRARLSAHGLTA